MRLLRCLALSLLALWFASPTCSFTPTLPRSLRISDMVGSALQPRLKFPSLGLSTHVCHMSSTDNEDKFSFGQRIESIKCVVIGALSGGVALTPVALLHDTLFSQGLIGNGLAQWEFDTDMGSLESALFAIVYRYCIRTDENPMLNQGVLGSFVLVRTLSRVQVPTYCSFAPLSCGAPLGYFDWSMLLQVAFSGAESVALFGGAALAMDYCFRKGFISKFP